MDQEVRITEAGSDIALEGQLTVPERAKGLVIFAHGSGSSRLSPRNLLVSRALQDAGVGTLLFDLLTAEESRSRENVFDIELLAGRLLMATRWLSRQSIAEGLKVGYFGASTGAGAALWAAAELKEKIAAVVSRGGRPDLAIPRLPEVTAPTLLLVGGWDELVIELNQRAMKHLNQVKLEVIPEATHVFEEPGKLEAVAKRAAIWFAHYLRPVSADEYISPPSL